MVVEAGLDQCKRHPGVSCGPAPGLSGCSVNTGCLPEGALVVFIYFLPSNSTAFEFGWHLCTGCWRFCILHISVLYHVHLLPSLACVYSRILCRLPSELSGIGDARVEMFFLVALRLYGLAFQCSSLLL